MYTSITSAYFFCLSLSMQTHNSIICSCGEWDLTILLFIPFLCCHRFSLQNQNKLHSNSFHHCNNLLCLSQHMALPVSSPMLFFFFIFFSIFPSNNNAEGPPSPGYYPSSRIASIPFNQAFSNLWGPQHQTLDQETLTIWLDQTSGSGFKSLNPYSWGYFGAAIKLQPGYTAGVITCLYLSNNEEYPGMHDEIDIEFLGTTEDKPYVVQTNVYIKGSGDGDGNRNIIGREIKFHLWFDPTTDFHNYAILWNPNEIIFYVDDVPIRRYPRKSDETYPKRPMWVYGSIWDASSWATENGKYKADYSYQPFIGHYNNFKIHACTAPSTASCHRVSGYPSRSHGLSTQQTAALTYVHDNYKVYDYCEDPQRDHALTPECVT